MRKATLGDLQESLADKSGFKQLGDYAKFCSAYLALVKAEQPTRIVSPSPANEHYVFYASSTLVMGKKVEVRREVG